MRKLLILGAVLAVTGWFFLKQRPEESSVFTETGPKATATVLSPEARPTTASRPGNGVFKSLSPSEMAAPAASEIDDTLARARDLVSAGKKEDARLELEKALAADPKNSELQTHLGEFYSQELGDPQKAIPLLKSAYLNNPSRSRALESLIDALKDQGDLAKSEAMLAEIRREVPDQLEPALAQSDFYNDSKRPDAALAALQQAGKDFPNDPRVYDRQAEAYGNRKDYPNEGRSLKKGLSLIDAQVKAASDRGEDTTPLERDRASMTMDYAASLADGGNLDGARQVLKSIQTRYLRQKDLPLYQRLVGGVNAD